LKMAVEEREKATASGAAEALAESSANVMKYEKRIAMSEKTARQDKELLELAQNRLKRAQAQFPSAKDSDKAVNDLRQKDANLEKQQLSDQAEVMKLLETKVTGPKLEDAKERAAKVAIEVEQTTELKNKAKIKQAEDKVAAQQIADAQAKEKQAEDDAKKKQDEDDIAYAHKERANKASGKEAAQAKAIQDEAELQKIKEQAEFAATEKRKDDAAEAKTKIGLAAEIHAKSMEAEDRAAAEKKKG